MLWERERQRWKQIVIKPRMGMQYARNSREGKDQPGREDRCGPPEDFSEKGLLSWTSWEKKEWQRYPQ